MFYRGYRLTATIQSDLCVIVIDALPLCEVKHLLVEIITLTTLFIQSQFAGGLSYLLSSTQEGKFLKEYL